MKSELHVSPDSESLACFARDWLVQSIQNTLASQSATFTLALSGGSTPRRLYQLLAELPEKTIDWKRVWLLWGDERNVAPEHADSNYRMVKENLLDHVAIPADNILSIPDPGGEPELAAEQYETLLRERLPSSPSGWPQVNCVLLGLGDDVHTASLFPQTTALAETSRWAVANHVPQLGCWRITLTAPLINAAGQVAFLLSGHSKQAALEKLWHAPRNPTLYPAQLIHPSNGQLWFLADEAAVASLALPQSVSRQST